MDGRSDARKDGRASGRMGGRTVGRSDGRTGERADGATDGTVGRTDRRADDRRMREAVHTQAETLLTGLSAGLYMVKLFDHPSQKEVLRLFVEVRLILRSIPWHLLEGVC